MVASVRPSVRLFVRALPAEPFDRNRWASTDNRADAVDWLLIGVVFVYQMAKQHFYRGTLDDNQKQPQICPFE